MFFPLSLSLPYRALFIIEKILFFVLYVALALPAARVESDSIFFNTMRNASLKIRTKSSGRRREARGEDGRETIESKQRVVTFSSGTSPIIARLTAVRSIYLLSTVCIRLSRRKAFSCETLNDR